MSELTIECLIEYCSKYFVDTAVKVVMVVVLLKTPVQLVLQRH